MLFLTKKSYEKDIYFDLPAPGLRQYLDFNSHGTHCAGIAAAVGDNGIGMTGANPMAYIMPVAVLQSNGTGDVATIIQGINYAKNNGADVLSMSFSHFKFMSKSMYCL